MGSTVVLVGSMPSLASVIVSTALSTSPSTSGSLEFWSQRVSFSRPSLRRLRRWHCVSTSVCKYSVAATDFVDSRNAGTRDSDTSNSNRLTATSNADDTEIALKPAPKPLFKSEVDSLLSGKPVEQETSRVGPPTVENVGGGGGGRHPRQEERNKVIQSLGEVLEKAEKLETSKPGQLVSGIKQNGDKNRVAPSNTASDSRAASTRKSKTSKSVWRKGDAVATVQKVAPKTNSKVQRESRRGEDASLESQNNVTLRPAQPPVRPQPKLQAKPSVAPPPTLKKPVILKDVGATPKPPVVDQNELGSEKQQRKPILVDKFARKEPDSADPLISQAVLTPTKPGKGTASGKYKDRKKSVSPGGPRRRIVDDSEIVEEASELNVSIQGAATTRKGRKWSKASRKAARLLAAKEADRKSVV